MISGTISCLTGECNPVDISASYGRHGGWYCARLYTTPLLAREKGHLVQLLLAALGALTGPLFLCPPFTFLQCIRVLGYLMVVPFLLFPLVSSVIPLVYFVGSGPPLMKAVSLAISFCDRPYSGRSMPKAPRGYVLYSCPSAHRLRISA